MRAKRTLALVTFALAGVVCAWAQQKQQRGGGTGQRNWMGFYMWLRRFDADANLNISEDEFSKSMQNMQKSATEAYAILLKSFDANGDGTLQQDELQKARMFIYTLRSFEQYDKNRDFKLAEEEYTQAWETLASRCQDFNDMILDRFDKDHNGELSAEEVAPAKQEMQNRMGGRGQRGGGGRGGQ